MIKKEYELGIETQDGARVVVVRPFVFAQNFFITFFYSAKRQHGDESVF